ncbi:hypothetical protein ACVW00_000062 [Marmoricola sp. URHA0025 HA25]
MNDVCSVDELLRLGADRPRLVREAKKARRRPTSALNGCGRMFVIAADHTARGATGAGGQDLALANRRELLQRLVVALSRPEVNGVLASADVLEELLLLGALKDKVVFGTMNRGGLQGADFEFDDRFTAYTPDALAESGFEGGKMLLRIAPDDPGTVRTLEACAAAVDALARHSLMAMVEPFMSQRTGGKVTNELTAGAMARAIGIAAGLGSSAAHVWLKVPAVPDLESALEASTLPALILGGEVPDDQARMLDEWAAALALPTVFGLVVGRSLLFPPDDDVEGVLDAAIALME